MTEKYPLIVWSGGLDSTALVLDAISNKERFHALYVDLENNKIKSKLEKKAREDIIQVVGAEHFVSDITVYQPNVISYSGNKQAPIWLAGIVCAIDPETVSEVRMGYVEYDQFWHIKTEFVNAYNSMFRLCFPENNDVIPLKFPLEWETKEGIIKKYYSGEFDKLLSLIWVCEWPKNKKAPHKPCNKCHPCARFNQALNYN